MSNIIGIKKTENRHSSLFQKSNGIFSFSSVEALFQRISNGSSNVAAAWVNLLKDFCMIVGFQMESYAAKMMHLLRKKSFKTRKCKYSLKNSVARIKVVRNKIETRITQLKREVAGILFNGDDQLARIRVDHVIKEEKIIKAYDLIEVYCEFIVSRLTVIESQKHCPVDLREPISSVIFASKKCADIPDLMDVQKHFVLKYGQEFVTASLELRANCGVNPMIVSHLSPLASDIKTKVKVLTAIAKENGILWEPKSFDESSETLEGSKVDTSDSFGNQKESFSLLSSKNLLDNRQRESNVDLTENESERLSASSYSVHSMPISHPSELISPEEMQLPLHNYRQDVYYSSESNRGMSFKDAASAAMEAAESAERASIAARIAVLKLKSNSGGSGDTAYGSQSSSSYEIIDGTPRRSVSFMISEPVSRNHIRHEREQSEREFELSDFSRSESIETDDQVPDDHRRSMSDFPRRKVPDYETIHDYFQSLRSNNRGV